jgi:IS4 transposase
VMIADGTVLRLHEFLSGEFQARHEPNRPGWD